MAHQVLGKEVEATLMHNRGQVRDLLCCSLKHNDQVVTLASGEVKAGVYSSISGKQISLLSDNTHTHTPVYRSHDPITSVGTSSQMNSAFMQI